MVIALPDRACALSYVLFEHTTELVELVNPSIASNRFPSNCRTRCSPSISRSMDSILSFKAGIILLCLTSSRPFSSCVNLSDDSEDSPGVGAGDLSAPLLAPDP